MQHSYVYHSICFVTSWVTVLYARRWSRRSLWWGRYCIQWQSSPPWHQLGMDFIGLFSQPSLLENQYNYTDHFWLLYIVWLGQGSTNEGGCECGLCFVRGECLAVLVLEHTISDIIILSHSCFSSWMYVPTVITIDYGREFHNQVVISWWRYLVLSINWPPHTIPRKCPGWEV